MNAQRYWNGVRMRTVMAAPDPDAPPRQITLPADWDDDAASALADIAPGTGAVSIAAESARWIDALVPARDDAKAAPVNGRSLAWLLMLRQAAPTLALWSGEFDRRPGFVVNLAAFVLPGEGFSGEAYVAALRLLCATLRLEAEEKANRRNGELALDDAATEPTLFDLPVRETRQSPDTRPERNDAGTPDLPLGEPASVAGEILLTNLDACLAALGLDYDSDDGRDAACSLVALATLVVREGTGCDHLPLTPHRNVIPGLALVAREAWARAAVETVSPAQRIETGFSGPGPVDALLGCEACGLAPIFSPLRTDGRLATSTLARLAARGLSVETAFAACLAGDVPLALPAPDAHMRMYRALAGFVDRVPARPDPSASPLPRIPPRGVARMLPDRHTGVMQKTSIGGHRLFLRTTEYDDGTLGEISLTPARENAMVRGLLECFSEAVSVGLQYGVPLEDFVERFAYSCFGPAGTVEGDPVASYATSMLDYAFRALSDLYLGRRLPDAPHEDAGTDSSPLLPFEFDATGAGVQAPGQPRRRGLRLVS
ncbi:TSCPD domain-containing protein [Acetobacter fallax]|uniref:ribonucleoside-diphosphate reductase n=1 Tax=Acetobacter fallax TaxID=1737473 RepID=A0ABX0K692_9PROT|nr:vitamin B12-dependent ribonucleotide reductase [Acetobacter fallax]NHO31912.1 vitamin B12-dependent ribonucleotide reductase [Acetobacter fallax]NHO35572.1 vitamin B12-dependent ribonucleotide reductase [Acetobacter fallax]